MKKKLSLLMVALVAVAAFAVQATKRATVEKSYTITFKEGSGTTSDSGTKISSIADIIADGADYVSDIPTADNVYNARVGRGIKLGTSSKTGSLTLTLAQSIKPTKITFKARKYNDTETAITVNNKEVTELTGDFNEYTIEYDGNTEVSEIAISTPLKRAYITEVSVFYEEEGGDEPTTRTATFENDGNWAAVYAYAWTTTGEGDAAVTTEFLGAWPGTKLEATDDGYVVSITSEVAPEKIIFNNGDGIQTGDLAFEDGATYNSQGKVVPEPELKDFSVTFTTDAGWENVFAYAWNEDNTPLAGWPGVDITATKNGDGVYTYAFKAATAPTGIIFNNGLDGDAKQQTADLTFENGKAYSYSTPKDVTTLDFTTVDVASVPAEYVGNYGNLDNYTIADATQGVKMLIKNNEAANNCRFWNNSGALQLRIYNGATLTFEPIEEGKVIKKITFEAPNWGTDNSTDVETLTGKEWAGEAAKVVLTIAGGKTFINKITVEIGDATVPELNTYTATFTNNGNWAEVYAYTWSGEGESKVEQLGAWPGTKLEASDAGYVATIQAAAAPEKIIFTAGANGPQTADLDFTDGATYSFEAPAEDITVKLEEACDIAAAVNAAMEDKNVGSVTIELTKDVAYTFNSTVEVPGALTVWGNDAVIDASALEGNMFQWKAKAAEDTEWTTANVEIAGVKITGLKKALFYSNSKYYVAENFTINWVDVQQAADAITFDFTKGSTAVNFNVTNSTFYAPAATTKSFYSSQGGQKTTEYKEDATQTFKFHHNTMYNLAPSKNFFSHRQSNQKWLAYDVQENIFVNCGKSGQVIKGMNGGQSGANPTWIVKGNAFNFDNAETGVREDTSAAESTGDEAEPVQDSVAGVVTFTDAANGDFNGTFDLAEGATAPEALGAPAWTIAFPQKHTVTFKTDRGWEKVYAYTWSGEGDSKVEQLGAWPGTEMTPADGDINNGFGITFKSATAPEKIIFNNGTEAEVKQQTADLDFEDGKAYEYNYFTPVFAEGTYYVMNASTGKLASALTDAHLDKVGTPLTFTFDAETGTYSVTGISLLEGKQVIAEGDTYYTFSFIQGGLKMYAAVNAAEEFTLTPNAEDVGAVWILMTQEYWENEALRYNVAGTADLCGTAWDTNANTMTKNTETGLYEWTATGIAVSETIKPEFKVAINNVADPEDIQVAGWIPTGEANWIITLGALGEEGVPAEEGLFNITITFDAATKVIAVAGERTGDLPVVPEDITVKLEEAGDIADAVNAAMEGKNVGAVTIELTKDVAYTFNSTVEVPGALTVWGNDAVIDASALEGNMFQWKAKAAEDTEWTTANVEIAGVKITGLKKALFYSNSKYYVAEDFNINWVNVEQAGDATTFDFTKGSTAKNFTVENSTFYAPAATTKSFYSSQGGQKTTEWKSDATQTFKFHNNTMYNLAPTKNFFSHRQSNQTWLTYDVKENIFVNCGKSGQVIKGMNGGQSGKNPTWIISGNAFNFDNAETGVREDTSAAESTGDEDEPVQASVAGIVTFTDAANGDFNGTFDLAEGATAPEALGAPKWTITFVEYVEPKLYIMGNGTTGGWNTTTEMTFNETTQAFEYDVTATGDTYFTFGDAEFTNWDDWNANNRLAIAVGDQPAELETEYQLVKVNGTVKITATGTLHVSVTKDLKMTVTLVTGIDAVKNAAALKDAQIYNLKGQRVDNAQKGLYIVNGRKVVIK